MGKSIAVLFLAACATCLATSVQATTLSIVNTNHSYPIGTTQVAIPIQITGDVPVLDFSAHFRDCHVGVCSWARKISRI